MKKLTLLCVMLASAFTLSAVPSLAQQAKGSALDKMDFGLTYTYKFAKAATTSGPEFTIPGGAVDAAYTPGGKWKGFGLAIDVNGESAQDVKPGINLSQISFVAGPRYTLRLSRGSLYAESLYGMVHAFNSVFPAGGGTVGVQPTANGFASQDGGGINVDFCPHIGWRIVAVDYIYTRLPNATDTYQSDTRLSSGVTFHF